MKDKKKKLIINISIKYILFISHNTFKYVLKYFKFIIKKKKSEGEF